MRVRSDMEESTSRYEGEVGFGSGLPLPNPTKPPPYTPNSDVASSQMECTLEIAFCCMP